jgi:hypothetical protein
MNTALVGYHMRNSLAKRAMNEVFPQPDSAMNAIGVETFLRFNSIRE